MPNKQLVPKSKVTPVAPNHDDEYQDDVSDAPESKSNSNSNGGHHGVPQPQVYEDTEQYASDPRTTGVVKWFNDKTGIGFITIIAGDNKGTDIFVHQSNVRPRLSNYRTLTAGEYVEFVFGEADNNDTEGKSSNHKHQALYVTGILGGALLCDNNNGRSNTAPRRPYQGGSHSSYRHDGDRRDDRRGDDRRGPRRNNRSDDDDDYVGVGSRGRVVAPSRH